LQKFYPVPQASCGEGSEKNGGHQTNSRTLLRKSFMLPNITSMFDKKKGHAGSSSPSHLPGKNPCSVSEALVCELKFPTCSDVYNLYNMLAGGCTLQIILYMHV
jgi:hypothetical protein